MPTATITSKGQITIPAKVREDLGLEAGDRIEFLRNESTGHYEVIPSTVSVLSLKGILPKAKRTVSIEEMNDAIAAEGSSPSR